MISVLVSSAYFGAHREIYYSGHIQTHCQNNKKIKRADKILPEVYGTTLMLRA
jgi:hypothetical protein